MRLMSTCLATTSLVLVSAFAAMPAPAADLDATSSIDTVTVYPDGASVTRVISLDLPSGDNTLVAKDFPLTLDPSSLRVEGEAGEKLAIGAIDTRAAAAAAPGQSVRNRPSHRDAQRSARRSRRRDCRCRSAAQICRTVCGGLSGRDWARRARRGRSRTGARPLPRSPTKSRPPKPRSAIPGASSATSTARSRGSSRTATPNLQPSSRFASISHRPPRRKRRCGSPIPCAMHAGRRSTMRGSRPAPGIASRRLSWCAVPRSRNRPARTGRT